MYYQKGLSKLEFLSVLLVISAAPVYFSVVETQSASAELRTYVDMEHKAVQKSMDDFMLKYGTQLVSGKMDSVIDSAVRCTVVNDSKTCSVDLAILPKVGFINEKWTGKSFTFKELSWSGNVQFVKENNVFKPVATVFLMPEPNYTSEGFKLFVHRLTTPKDKLLSSSSEKAE